MSDVEWDADDFEPKGIEKSGPSDKWEGEDDDDNLKENWFEDDEEEKSDDSQKAVQVKKKKPLRERIAEREAKKLKEHEEEQQQKEEERKKLAPEEILKEKMRLKKAQEDSDLELAREALGLNVNVSEEAASLIDGLDPSSKEDFDQFVDVLGKKITQYEKSPFYVPFLESLYRILAVNLESEEMKKLASVLNTLANEKSKQEKAAKGKKGTKSKAKINLGSKQPANDYAMEGIIDEFDDFM